MHRRRGTVRRDREIKATPVGRSVVAVGDFFLAAPTGSLFGFLGPDSFGKSAPLAPVPNKSQRGVIGVTATPLLLSTMGWVRGSGARHFGAE